MAQVSLATPSPSGGSGTAGHNNNYTVTGTGFGSKISPIDGTSLPWGYWDFEDGTQNPVDALSAGSDALVDQNMSVAADSTRGNSTKSLQSADINWASFANGGIVSIVFSFPDQAVGQKQYFSAHRWSERSDYSHTHSGTGATDMDENWKFYRGFPTSGTTYPNTVISQAAESASSCTGGGSRRVSVESSNGATNYTQSAIRLPSSTWMEEEYTLQFNSSDFGTNGTFRLWQDGDLNFDKTDFSEDRSPDATDDLQRQFIQDDPANMTDCGGATVAHDVKYDDAVADYGTYAWARVMLGNASTLTACTQLEYQPATSWSSTSITFKQKWGAISSGSSKYIYVFDSDGTVNSTGRLLATGAGDPPPVLASIDPTTGSRNGGGTITVTGTGFTDGFTVKFGTATPITATFVNSTSGTVTLPAGPESATVDVVVANPDGQTSLLGAAFTYDDAPEIPIYADQDPIVTEGALIMFGVWAP